MWFPKSPLWRKNDYRGHLRFKKSLSAPLFSFQWRQASKILKLWFHTSFNPAQNISPNLPTTSFVPGTKTGSQIENYWLPTRQKTGRQIAPWRDKLFQPAHRDHTHTSPHTKQDSKEEGGSTTLSSNTVVWWSNHGLKKKKSKWITWILLAVCLVQTASEAGGT